MIRYATLSFAVAVLAALALAAHAGATEAPCELEPRAACFGVESAAASLSTAQAGAHPDLTLDVAIKQDPETEPNAFGLQDAYSPTRDIRFNTPPGVIGDPNALGAPQLCKVQELVGEAHCPNGSQVGISTIATYQYHANNVFHEPVYMMQPPGGDVVARLGTVAGIYPTFIDFRVRSEGDYGLVAEVTEAPPVAKLIQLESTLWGVPADPTHNTERCTPAEVLYEDCQTSASRPPGSLPLPFLTNPTRCGVPLELGVNASSWFDPELDPAKEVAAAFPEITGCDRLPFGPKLEVEPTSHKAGAPTGLDLTIKLPASEGREVLEPAQTRYIKITFPDGMAINSGSGEGLATCSEAQVHFSERVAAECPNASKLADTEFDIPVLSRNVKGAIYIREPEPGNPFRIWIVADDLGLHVKLPGQLRVDKQSGQIESIVLGTPQTEGIPQAPLREVKLLFKSGFRAPLLNPPSCGTYYTSYEFTPWSGGPPATGSAPMTISEGCDTGGFSPKLSAGSTEAKGGAFSPFVFTITREDPEQNIAGLKLTLPEGFAAAFKGIARCEGVAAVSGNCPADSKIGHVSAAVGAGPAPLWVPQPGLRPTAVYLGGPYKGAPTSIVAVVPKQAGPFDFGDEVVRSAVYVNQRTAQATAVADPLPQRIEGIPVLYKTINVVLDRPHFALNPTSCEKKETVADLTSSGGKSASPSSSYAASDCAKLGFKPRLGLKLRGGTRRGGFPALHLVYLPRGGDANLSKLSLRFPRSEFIEQGHFRTICTRVQFAAAAGFGSACPAGSVYGHVKVWTPVLDEPLSGKVFLRSSDHNLPDVVLALEGPPSLPVQFEAATRIDSVHGGLRAIAANLPDVPLTRVVVDMQGGQKGLFVNSTNLCAAKHRAGVRLDGHNGRVSRIKPLVRAVKCGKHRAKRHGRHRHKRPRGGRGAGASAAG